MTSPDQHVRFVQQCLREAEIRVPGRGCTHLNVGLPTQKIGDGSVHAVGIDGPHVSEGDPKDEIKGDPEGDSDNDPETEADPESEADPEPDDEADPEAQPESGEGDAPSIESLVQQAAASATENLLGGAVNNVVTAQAASLGESGSAPILQVMVNDAMAAESTLSKRIQIILNRNTTYEGDVVISAGNRDVGEDFKIEITDEDALGDSFGGAGYTTIAANLLIRGVRVILNSIEMAEGKKISIKHADMEFTDDPNRGGELEYNGSNALPNKVTVDMGKNSSAKITTRGDDDEINVVMESGAKSVVVDAGKGANRVDAIVSGGDLQVNTGEGIDFVDANIKSGTQSVSVSTGGSNDYLLADSSLQEGARALLQQEQEDQASLGEGDGSP